MISPKTSIDPKTWSRKEHYEFFGNMPDPYFGITAKVDFTECWKKAKSEGGSFFLYSLHRILKALNSVPELRCRIDDGEVVVYDRIGASPTIAREDGSFGFAYFEYYEDLGKFVEEAKKDIERVRNGAGLSANENEGRIDLIYFSSIPWVDFTSLKQEGGKKPGDSIPEVTVGKLTDTLTPTESPDGSISFEHRKMMSVSIEVNHGLADGRHVGQFFDALTSRED